MSSKITKRRRIPKYLTTKEILLKYRKIDPITGCWLWTLSTNRGYGQLKCNGKNCKVHRLSHEIFIGPIKNEVLYKIICPNKICFNPEHLYDGDNFDNAEDMSKLRTHHNTKKVKCNRGHDFDRFYQGRRMCKECCKITRQERAMKLKEKK